MMRWIIAIYAVTVCACAPAEFSLGETDEDVTTDDSTPGGDSGVGSDAAPIDAPGTDTTRLPGEHDAGGDAEPIDTSTSAKDSAAATDSVVTDTFVATDTYVATDTTPPPSCSIPGKCDDGNACTDDGCDSTLTVCKNVFRDKDGDSYAPKTLGACGLDCNDSDSNAKPGQKTFFTTPQSGVALPFDYDCNGVEEKQYTTLGYCYYDDAGFCVFSAGFIISAPSCGTSKLYATVCNLVGEGCYPGGSNITQACR